MVLRKGLLLLLFLCLTNLPHGSSSTDPQDVSALISLSKQWNNAPRSWRHSGDPCGDNWEGINCSNNSRVTELLFNIGLQGTLSDDIGKLTELQRVDLSSNRYLNGPLPPSIGNLKKLQVLILIGCKFSGTIPVEVGDLSELQILSLNSNHFTGSIPASLGKLSNLAWLDLANNQLNGTIPTSATGGSGLNQLVNTLHFHLNNNQLSGRIPMSLFNSNMKVIHILLDRNSLSGEIPETIGLVQTLEVLRLDNNSLSESVPPSIQNLTKLSVLNLANNKLTGPMPNMSGMHALHNLDLSNNSFDPSEAPAWFSDPLQNLTTLIMESVRLQGDVPETLFSFPRLQEVRFNKNSFSGTLNMGSHTSRNLTMVNFEDNALTSVMLSSKYNDLNLTLVGNPICSNVHLEDTDYCQGPRQNLKPDLSDNVSCRHPYEVKMVLRAPYFGQTGDSKNIEGLKENVTSQLNGIQRFSIKNFSLNEDDYQQVLLQFCPSSSKCFTMKERLGMLDLNSKITSIPDIFGPFYFDAVEYPCGQKGYRALILGLVIGFTAAALAVVLIGSYAIRQKKQAERAISLSNPFVSWGSNGGDIGDAPHQKQMRFFSYDELRKCTRKFSNSEVLGSGGYGKVYKGILSSGQIVAIKRLQKDSMQGGLEFKTEIESLSRVHHKNLIELVGICYEKGERMLVYEYISNGNLSENLSGSRGIQLDWKRRVQIALDSATALCYLHKHADPPIIHRDVKSTNILLDDYLNAKVADFGLSKLVTEIKMGNVSSYVKGTMGYLDPEYFWANQLTEKSDVFSFGVVMLEIVTSRNPIKGGRHIIGEVEKAVNIYDKEYYGLRDLMDQELLEKGGLVGFKRFVDLALQCTQMSSEDRPTMDEVAKQIEMILKNMD